MLDDAQEILKSIADILNKRGLYSVRYTNQKLTIDKCFGHMLWTAYLTVDDGKLHITGLGMSQKPISLEDPDALDRLVKFFDSIT